MKSARAQARLAAQLVVPKLPLLREGLHRDVQLWLVRKQVAPRGCALQLGLGSLHADWGSGRHVSSADGIFSSRQIYFGLHRGFHHQRFASYSDLLMIFAKPELVHSIRCGEVTADFCAHDVSAITIFLLPNLIEFCT